MKSSTSISKAKVTMVRAEPTTHYAARTDNTHSIKIILLLSQTQHYM